MRVLLTTHQFLPHYGSGTEILTNSIARELVNLGHTVKILTGFPREADFKSNDRYEEYFFKGIHVYSFHHNYVPMGSQKSMIEIGFNNSLAKIYFEKILEDFKPNLVHFFHLNRLGTGLIDSTFLAKIPAFMTLTDFWLICPTGQLMYFDGKLCKGPTLSGGNCLKHFIQNKKGQLVQKIIDKFPTPIADSIVNLTSKNLLPNYPMRHEVKALGSRLKINVDRLNKLQGILSSNNFMTEILVRYGVHSELIKELSFGVKSIDTSKNFRRIGPRKPLQVGYIGTLIKHKGCHVLLKAVNLLPPGLVSLKIYGNTEQNPEYVRILKEQSRNSQSIEFCGTFNNEEIAEKFFNFDVLVVPSIWYENNPLVIYSAQAAFCPVIASNQPGIRALIKDGFNGLLFESGSHQQLAKLLEKLVNEEGLLSMLSNNLQTPKSIKTYVQELIGLWTSHL